jgi:hypothetical protein
MMRDKMGTKLRKYDALGNDVTETGDYQEALRVVAEHEQMLSDLGLTEESTQEEIDARKAEVAAEKKAEAEQQALAEQENNPAPQQEEYNPQHPNPYQRDPRRAF